MLTRVLLHDVKASYAVHKSPQLCANGQGTVGQMHKRVPVLVAAEHVCVVERTHIAGLAALVGKEGAAIQLHPPAGATVVRRRFGAGEHRGVKVK